MNDWLDRHDNDNPTGFWTTVVVASCSPTNNITPASLNLFLSLAKDAPNWDGAPLYEGNSKAERGNLTQLKVAGPLEVDQ